MDEMNFWPASRSPGVVWDREEVAVRIRQMYNLGRDISYVGVLQDYPELLFAGIYYYRNWAVSVTSAGIDYNKVRRIEIWNRGKIRKLLKRYKEGREDFRYNSFEKKHPGLFHAAVYHFGSWANAVSAVGMNYNKVKRFTVWDRGKIKRRIRYLYKIGKDISYKSMRRSGYTAVISAANFHFGGWGKAVAACGIDYDRIRKK